MQPCNEGSQHKFPPCPLAGEYVFSLYSLLMNASLGARVRDRVSLQHPARVKLFRAVLAREHVGGGVARRRHGQHASVWLQEEEPRAFLSLPPRAADYDKFYYTSTLMNGLGRLMV